MPDEKTLSSRTTAFSHKDDDTITITLNDHLDGENEKLSQQRASEFRARFGPLAEEFKALYQAASGYMTGTENMRRSYLSHLQPLYLDSNLSGQSLAELPYFQFLHNMGAQLDNLFMPSHLRLSQIRWDSKAVIQAIDNPSTTSYGDYIAAEERSRAILANAQNEFVDTVLAFHSRLRDIYLSTRKEFKRLRSLIMGRAANQLLAREKDNLEEEMLQQMFGFQRPAQEAATGSAQPLIDDNPVLTQYLMDICDFIPEEHTRNIPIFKNGVATGKVRATKIIDEGQTDDAVQLLAAASHSVFQAHAQAPHETLAFIVQSLNQFHSYYLPVVKALRDLLNRIVPSLPAQEQIKFEELRPMKIARGLSRVNFLSIQPEPEDVTPRNRVEREHAIARNKLLLYIKESVEALAIMPEASKEDYALARVKEAITLKKALKETIETEQQRQLARNIRDDNEFYIAAPSNHSRIGEIALERAPAPTIQYKDVIGESFIKAKAHLEEVVKVASHPYVMRLSAPRGDVKSNLLLIGSYGSGKSEILRAIAADRRVIGVSVAVVDLLTAYMHESPKNVKRLFDKAKDLRKGSRNTKPVSILLDEFDRLFDFGEGVNKAYDGGRMTGALQEMMDGVVSYEGVFMVCATNVPKIIPDAVLRRFKYVDVVGQLTKEERCHLFKLFLTRGMPIHQAVSEEDYLRWAGMLDHAPGDVLGKVADEVHFKYMREFVDSSPQRIAGIERALGRKLHDRETTDRDRAHLKKQLGAHHEVTAEEITAAVESTLKQPQIQMQISKAKEVYRDAEEILKGLAKVDGSGLGFGAERKSKLWSRD